MTIQDSSPERRNLIVTSLGFIIFFLGGGNLDGTEVKLQIINVTLGNPTVLVWVAWTMLFWFVWRYWLAFRGTYKQKRKGEVQKQSNNILSRIYVRISTGMKYLRKDGFKTMIVDPQNEKELHVTTIVDAQYDKRGKAIKVTNHGSVKVPLSPVFGSIVKCYIYLLVFFKEQGLASIYTPYVLFYFALSLGLVRLIQNHIII